MKYIVLDTETGGLRREHSLLTAAFAILDGNLNIIDRLELKLLPDNWNERTGEGYYRVRGQALSVNKLNLDELEKEGITIEKAECLLKQFIKKHAETGKTFIDPETFKPRPVIELLVPLGHHVAFDIERIKDTFPNSGWNKYVTYRSLDTMIIAAFLQHIGMLPMEQGIGLGKLAALYNIPHNAHDAMGDVEATIAVYREFRCLFINNPFTPEIQRP